MDLNFTIWSGFGLSVLARKPTRLVWTARVCVRPFIRAAVLCSCCVLFAVCCLHNAPDLSSFGASLDHVFVVYFVDGPQNISSLALAHPPQGPSRLLYENREGWRGGRGCLIPGGDDACIPPLPHPLWPSTPELLTLSHTVPSSRPIPEFITPPEGESLVIVAWGALRDVYRTIYRLLSLVGGTCCINVHTCMLPMHVLSTELYGAHKCLRSLLTVITLMGDVKG